MKFENARQPLLSSYEYFLRQLRFVIYGLLILSMSLLIGTLGYAYFGGLPVVDSFYNASMILTGMGPVNVLSTSAGKLFASFYALYSGVAFLTTVAVLLSPAIHRFLHILHIDIQE